jgi:hypothetical protein
MITAGHRTWRSRRYSCTSYLVLPVLLFLNDVEQLRIDIGQRGVQHLGPLRVREQSATARYAYFGPELWRLTYSNVGPVVRAGELVILILVPCGLHKHRNSMIHS